MLATARDRFLLALQYEDYRTLWTANVCAGAAAWALIVARGWLAFEITGGSSLWVGLVTFGAMAPRFFANPIIGFLADRLDRQTLLSWTYFFNLSHNVVLALLVMTGLAGPWLLVVLALTNGILRSGQQTTTQSLVPNLVPREYLLNAIALNEATQQGSRLVGAMAIAPLLALFSGNLEFAFWLTSALYGVGLIQILRIKTRSRGVIDRDRSFASNFVAGFAYVYRTPLVLAMVLIVLAHCSLTMSYESMLPAISQEKLGAGSVGVSYLLGGVGFGALFSAIFLAGIRSEKNRGRLFLLFGFTSGAGPILLALSTNRELSILATVAMGVNQAGFMTISHTIIQSIVPDWVRGRVSGVYSMHVGGSMALANLANGGFSDVFTASAVMAVGGALFLIAISLSVTSGSLRGIYFPRAATPVPA
ncbi:MAG: hypothetical protein BZY88_07670 [SAR202 cluster bacterium Io17-Chloro-G9]|nr:MAG: hypothetical protein BZY88_07670 [SAR202 cluster bacterium Io17-Chloro-G9]